MMIEVLVESTHKQSVHSDDLSLLEHRSFVFRGHRRPGVNKTKDIGCYEFPSESVWTLIKARSDDTYSSTQVAGVKEI